MVHIQNKNLKKKKSVTFDISHSNWGGTAFYRVGLPRLTSGLSRSEGS